MIAGDVFDVNELVLQPARPRGDQLHPEVSRNHDRNSVSMITSCKDQYHAYRSR